MIQELDSSQNDLVEFRVKKANAIDQEIEEAKAG
jgi:hypothetical protein